jgi:hypothetical protein
MNGISVVGAAEFCARAMQMMSHNDVCKRFDARKKSLFYRYISQLRAFAKIFSDIRRCARVQRARQREELISRDICFPARTRFVKRSRCFFNCTVVIGVQCRSIRGRTDPTPAMDFMARRAAMAKRRKKAVKAAKKTRRKKRL